MSVLSRLVEAARKQYGEINRPHVIVHAVTAVSYFLGGYSFIRAVRSMIFFYSIAMVLNSTGTTSNRSHVVR